MVATMENILSAAAQEEPVKRFVLTSSSAAVLITQAIMEVVVTKGIQILLILSVFVLSLTSTRYMDRLCGQSCMG